MAGKGADLEVLQQSGDRLRELREHLNLSLGDLAARVGLSRGYLGDIERGRKRLTPFVASKIVKALGVKIEDLDGPCPYCAGSGSNLYGT